MGENDTEKKNIDLDANNYTSQEIEKSWHRQQEDILKDWSEQASCYRWMHMRAFLEYQTRNFRFALPVIILSTITGTANFAQNSFPDNMKTWVPLIIGFFNLAAGLITTISQFLKVAELMEGHRAASIAYSKLSRNIAIELSLPSNERSTIGIEYIKKCRLDFDRLIEQTPVIPMNILSNFQKNMNEIIQLDSSGVPAFSVPAILKLEPVDIYRKELADKEKQLEIEMQESVYKARRRREEEAIEKYNKERLQILKEGILQGKLNMIKNINEGKFDEKKQDKKDTMTIKSLTKRMGKFQKILEESSSDDEEELNYTNVMLTNNNNFEFDTVSDDGEEEEENTTIDISNNETEIIDNSNNDIDN